MIKVPDKIGKYTVVGEIARGGMGAIYKAEHPTLDRFVVIKKLTLSGSASIRERFRREAAIMMDFRNEYIVDVFDHFREGSASYIVQEYVDGLSLEGLLARERYLPERIALIIFRDACRALKYAHEHGVVHRDIKPGNLLISKKGDVKLVDFGIARVEDDTQDVLTREGMTLGTPSYMAPEQFGNTKNVDKRADIYSLGVMLYESVTGKRPFPGVISPETIHLIQLGKYRSPRRVNPALTSFTVSVIKKTMHAKLKRRYQ
ncbi:MAG: serine/threonine-protein kinase, partial [Treponemataceae bacterium]